MLLQYIDPPKAAAPAAITSASQLAFVMSELATIDLELDQSRQEFSELAMEAIDMLFTHDRNTTFVNAVSSDATGKAALQFAQRFDLMVGATDRKFNLINPTPVQLCELGNFFLESANSKLSAIGATIVEWTKRFIAWFKKFLTKLNRRYGYTAMVLRFQAGRLKLIKRPTIDPQATALIIKADDWSKAANLLVKTLPNIHSKIVGFWTVGKPVFTEITDKLDASAKLERTEQKVTAAGWSPAKVIAAVDDAIELVGTETTALPKMMAALDKKAEFLIGLSKNQETAAQQIQDEMANLRRGELHITTIEQTLTGTAIAVARAVGGGGK